MIENTADIEYKTQEIFDHIITIIDKKYCWERLQCVNLTEPNAIAIFYRQEVITPAELAQYLGVSRKAIYTNHKYRLINRNIKGKYGYVIKVHEVFSNIDDFVTFLKWRSDVQTNSLKNTIHIKELASIIDWSYSTTHRYLRKSGTFIFKGLVKIEDVMPLIENKIMEFERKKNTLIELKGLINKVCKTGYKSMAKVIKL